LPFTKPSLAVKKVLSINKNMRGIMKKTILRLTLTALILSTATSAFASLKLETKSMKEIYTKVLEMGKKHGVTNVLAVFDIDNTLLAFKKNFGSDQWFTWQSKNCVGKKTLPENCVTTSFGQLLKIQGQIFALGPMIPTESKLPGYIKDLQSKGYKVIALTSRGHEFRNSTENELKSNGYNFSDSALGPKAGYAGKYKPYDYKNFSASGITAAEKKIAKLKDKAPRSVSYNYGVYMTAGQNKGIMLKNLLNKTNSNFKAIIFADDHIKHTIRMQAIFKDIVDLTTYRYGKIDAQVQAFKAGDKSSDYAEFKKLQKLIKSAF
jgi:hypothetical protein